MYMVIGAVVAVMCSLFMSLVLGITGVPLLLLSFAVGLIVGMASGYIENQRRYHNY